MNKVNILLEDSKLTKKSIAEINEIMSHYKDTDFMEITIRKKYTTRTTLQNRALWKWYKLISEAYKESGEPKIEQATLSWIEYWVSVCEKMQNNGLIHSKEDVHNLLMKPIILKMYGKTSSKDLTTKEFSKCCKVFGDMMEKTLGVDVPFPEDEVKKQSNLTGRSQ